MCSWRIASIGAWLLIAGLCSGKAGASDPRTLAATPSGPEVEQSLEAQESGRLLAVDVRDTEEGAAVRLWSNGPLERRKMFILRDPYRLVIDFPELRYEGPEAVEGSGTYVDQVRLGENSERVRVVIDAPEEAALVQRQFAWLPDGLLLTLGQGAAVPWVLSAPAEPAQGGGVELDAEAVSEPAAMAEWEDETETEAQPEPETVNEEPLEPVSAPPPRTELVGPSYDVTGFKLGYLEPVAGAPSASELLETQVELKQLGDTYVGVGRGGELVRFRLDRLPAGGPTRFHASAINSINQQLVAELNRRGLGGVIVAPDDQDIDLRSAVDIRGEGRTALKLTVFLPTIGEVQTFAQGDRLPQEEATNNPVHAKVLENSPVAAGEPLRPRLLDDYVARLNRHPGRRVTAQLSPSREPGRVYLDYQINEAKPWLFYAQYANTGTESTTENQLRTGLVHYQLTGRDDILELDYLTGGFDEVTAVRVAYDTPLPFLEDRLRLRVAGDYSSFDAEEELGFFLPGTKYEGQQSTVGLELSYNVFQHRELFVDLFTGIRYQNIEADNKDADIRGKTGFMLPRAGLGLDRRTETSKLTGSLFFEWNVPEWGHTQRDEIANLGRLDPDRDFVVMRWDANLSFFLEPLINPSGYRDLGTPRSSAHAHELYFSFRGQDAFDYRLVPHHQQIAGGFYTVRGYDQGVTAGDNVYLLTAEYRFHVPRILLPRRAADLPILKEFAVAPRQVGGRPDWDLILRVFYDWARVKRNDRFPEEPNDRLRGVGVGAELAIKRWLSVRFDWAVGLDDARNGAVRKNGSEGYVSVNLF
jgi:hemolysin activation/secretion protein